MQTWNLVAHTETTVRIYSKFQINLSQDKVCKIKSTFDLPQWNLPPNREVNLSHLWWEILVQCRTPSLHMLPALPKDKKWTIWDLMFTPMKRRGSLAKLNSFSHAGKVRQVETEISVFSEISSILSIILSILTGFNFQHFKKNQRA